MGKPVYGPRDAASVMMGRGHRVAWRSKPVPLGLLEGGPLTHWLIDGQPVSLRELEDQAEVYERLRCRITTRAHRFAPIPADVNVCRCGHGRGHVAHAGARWAR